MEVLVEKVDTPYKNLVCSKKEDHLLIKIEVTDHEFDEKIF